MSLSFGIKTTRRLLPFKTQSPIAMAPRRSARVSALTQQAALDNNSIQDQQPSSKAAKRKTPHAQAGITAKKPTKIISKHTGGRGKKVSIPKAAAVAAAAAATAATATASASASASIEKPTSKTPDPATPSTPKRQTRPNTTNKPSPALNRPIDPHLTTATLLTPRGSHLTAYPANPEDASPSKTTGLPRRAPTTTTGTLLEEAIAHLIKVAPQLRPVIEKHPCPLFSPAGLAEEVDPFNSLVSGIIGQQVSGAAAKSIKKKFIGLFCSGGNDKDNDIEVNNNVNGNEDEKNKPETAEMRYDRDDNFPTPAQVAKCDIATLRTAGLSQRKAEYIQGLAEKFASGELGARMLLQASDEEVLEKLIAVRGLGRWSVEMFSCFGLKRMDVFSTGDLGVQ